MFNLRPCKRPWCRRRYAMGKMSIRSLSVGFLVIVYGLFSVYMVLVYRMDPLLSSHYSMEEFTNACVNRTRLLNYLVEFQRELQNENVPLSLRMKLQEIIEYSKFQEVESTQTQTECESTSSSQEIACENRTQLLEVCPEKWTGRGNNLYYLDSWKTVDCTNALPFNSVITILLYPSSRNSVNSSCSEQVYSVLTGLQKSYNNLTVLVANVDDFCRLESTSPQVQYIAINGSSSRPGKVWNSLVTMATTPYVLIGRDLDNFMSFSDLKRSVRVLGNDGGVKITGGAVRNRTGHWRVGCYQSSLRNYILKYQEGYYNSKNDCMFCDYLVGPFVARTVFLKENPFHESLPNEVLFEEFFLKVKQSHHSVVNCPDVMYFASDSTIDAKRSNRSVWLPLVRHLELNRIVVPHNHVFSFSCQESGLKCKITKLVESFLMPICCVEQFARAVVFIDKFCRRHKIPYEFAGGTVMGIIKMGDMMPWDHDGDLFYRGNYTIFEKFKKEFEENGVKAGELVVVKKEYRWTYFTPDIDIDMSGCVQMSYDSLEDKMFHDIPTQAELHGHWVYVMPNPGGYSRNNYGYETLKHAHHFLLLKQKFDQPYKGGFFRKCQKPSHHACLDHFSTDGSLQFVVPN